MLHAIFLQTRQYGALMCAIIYVKPTSVVYIYASPNAAAAAPLRSLYGFITALCVQRDFFGGFWCLKN